MMSRASPHRPHAIQCINIIQSIALSWSAYGYIGIKCAACETRHAALCGQSET
jgi:hypothetical protein